MDKRYIVQNEDKYCATLRLFVVSGTLIVNVINSAFCVKFSRTDSKSP